MVPCFQAIGLKFQAVFTDIFLCLGFCVVTFGIILATRWFFPLIG